MAYIPQLLATGSVSAAATLPINMSAYYNLYSVIEVQYTGLIPVTTNTDLCIQVSVDGTTFDTAAASYDWVVHYDVTTLNGINSSQSDTQLHIAQSINNSAGSHVSGSFRIFAPSNASLNPAMIGQSFAISNTTSSTIMNTWSGYRKAAQLTKGVRLQFSTGNITSGTYSVIGYK